MLKIVFGMRIHIPFTGIWIAVVLMALMVACNPQKEKEVEPMEKPLPELAAIDSLMWQQPDSALMCLLPYFDTCCRDGVHTVSTTYDRHSANLLLAELLYKNYKPQTNRDELLRAVDYFDSLCCRDAARHVSTDPILMFLDARAHYINGAGFYEQGNVVNACAEYLKALEVMEEQFEEKALKGKKAVFMFYIYNRLLELFSEQFMMDPALTCGEKALEFCQNEPSMSKEIPNLYTHIGKQYEKKGEKEIARNYYGLALEVLSDANSLVYRDAVSIKALSDYNAGLGADSSLTALKQVLAQANTEKEKLTRFFTIGVIFTAERFFDSALYYLEPVFENEDNVSLQIQAAEYLIISYNNLGNKEKSDECIRFLSNYKKTDGENKALVSKLEDLYKDYSNQKKEKEAEEAREKSIRKTVEIIVPIAVLIALAIFVVAKRRSKKLLEDKDRHYQREMEAKESEARKKLEEKDKQYSEVLEAERQAYRMEQAAISGRLKRSNQEVRELKDQIKQLDDLAAETEVATSFDEEPICRLIMDRVNEGQFKSKIDYIIYKDSALDKQQLLDLRLAVDRHFGQFTIRLKKAYPELTNGDLDYCCLYLLGLTDADIAALMQRTYNTVFERNSKMRKIFGSENPLPITLIGMAKGSLFV